MCFAEGSFGLQLTILDYMRQRVEADGPMALSEVMKCTLTHPCFGYYATRNPLGALGDFVTAPEISQMFGELIGLWAVVSWQQIGSPRRFNFIELGPGSGMMMNDALRASQLVPDFHVALDLHLVEASLALRKIQKNSLAGYAPTWHNDVYSLPCGPSIIIANEFFDAMPITQLVRGSLGWHERRLSFDQQTKMPIWTVMAETSHLASLLHPKVLTTGQVGEIAEVSSFSLSIADALARRLVSEGGVALVIDYGYCNSALGDTLQAVKKHKFVDVLENLGQSDLTAHVDFAALSAAVNKAGAIAYGPITQSAFLLSLGIIQRTYNLMKKSNYKQARSIEAAMVRLIDSKAMGSLFKVSAWSGREVNLLPGL
ncbi:aby [Candidatus Endolissoclinum faulkneri L5]|uniref:Aby n=1 Tax=Candidatus Endolissoclinum faulkneri L5 TaxID=1401328 RepID=V9TS04_9PROT|nr:aby [Candidatus Endolissoclinum faulkneri L5]